MLSLATVLTTPPTAPSSGTSRRGSLQRWFVAATTLLLATPCASASHLPREPVNLAQAALPAAAPMSISPTGTESRANNKAGARKRMAAGPAVTQPAPSAQLPNGASSITETYGDWTVTCRIDDGVKSCVLSQAQGNKETGQRSFAIELRTPRDGKTDGTILMPFGLTLDSGAILKLDDRDLGKGLRFSTCVPQGCLLPVSFPTVATDAMRTAKTLTVASLNLGSGQAVTFNVSLNGFAAALARVSELGK